MKKVETLIGWKGEGRGEQGRGPWKPKPEPKRGTGLGGGKGMADGKMIGQQQGDRKVQSHSLRL
jgi:hypothetical protein